MIKPIFKFLFGGFLLTIAATGCMQSKPLDDAAIATRADSIYNARKAMVIDSMSKDCETNKGIWIQMKADSMYKVDSAAKAMMKK